MDALCDSFTKTQFSGDIRTTGTTRLDQLLSIVIAIFQNIYGR
ncbi:Uncharacterised protein [Vibrio cholerae]|nr:Uncharacterised protein [Vibrio cholerae]CSC42926.1 Uncharacterised protein [Vibrio cholerae]CSD26962.1 Uncharacterised protein [Vibrio cholerae]